MATWEDGPEYAPYERPDDFVVPSQPPLAMPRPYEQQARLAPIERPAFADPPVPVAPLATLVPVAEERRDPSIPFEVAASTMTANESSAWGAVHWNAPSGPPILAAPLSQQQQPLPSSALPGQGHWNPNQAGQWPAPDLPLVPRTGPAPAAPGFPAPGTVGWFAPPPPGAQPLATGSVGLKEVIAATTPGVIICLLIGAVIYILSPVTLVVAAVLVRRVRVEAGLVRLMIGVGLGIVVLVTVVSTLSVTFGFSDWWDGIAWAGMFVSWALVVAIPLVVLRALRRGDLPMPPRSNWG